MKSTGIVRKVDELGRIVLPKELRDSLKITRTDPLEFYVDGASLILKKYQSACIFCHEAANVTDYRGIKLCPECLRALKAL